MLYLTKLPCIRLLAPSWERGNGIAGKKLNFPPFYLKLFSLPRNWDCKRSNMPHPLSSDKKPRLDSQG